MKKCPFYALRITVKILILVSISTFFIQMDAMAQSFEINTVMMNNTYKIQGEGSTGTCFIVGRPLQEDSSKGEFILVTAAHVLEDMVGDEATIYLRKKKDGIFVKISMKIKIREQGKDLWTKNKSGVDVAVMKISIPKDTQISLLPISLLASDETLKKFEIHPGDEMLCLGFPLLMEANEAGFPILRSGKIASYPLVPTKENKFFYLDFPIFNGNSGGPVYFVESNRIYDGGTHLGKIQFIAGLVSQEFFAKETIKSLTETSVKKHTLAIAKIIHATYIVEAINQLFESE